MCVYKSNNDLTPEGKFWHRVGILLAASNALMGRYVAAQSGKSMHVEEPVDRRAYDNKRIYKHWSTVAGYFDGDGTVEFSVHGWRVEIA